MTPISEVTNLRIGQSYLVPSVYVRWWKQDVPVLLPAHRDIEVIGFPHLHWHIDWRFTTLALIDYLNENSGNHERIIPPDQRYTGVVVVADRDVTCSIHADKGHMTDGEVRQLPFELRRWSPDFPITGFTHRLELAFARARMQNMICPHRGANLRCEPVTSDGRVQCPMHGLEFDVESGMVRARDPLGIYERTARRYRR